MNDMWLPQPGSAGNAVYGQLKERIVTLELPPGTALSEKRWPRLSTSAAPLSGKALSGWPRRSWWSFCRSAARACR